MTGATHIHSLPINGDIGSVTTSPADPVGGVDMIKVSCQLGLLHMHVVVPASYLVEGIGRATGLGDQLGPFYTVEGFADRCGLEPQTIRKYRTMHRLPPPDHRFGRSDVWTAATIDRWTSTRFQSGHSAEGDGHGS